MNEFQQDLDVWAYRPSSGGGFRMEMLNPFVGTPKSVMKVIDLDCEGQNHGNWWFGHVVCCVCRKWWIGMIERSSPTAPPPATLPCPGCKTWNVAPVVNWKASCQASCKGCGRVSRMVFAESKPDDLPTSWECPYCGTRTSDVRPWPSPS